MHDTSWNYEIHIKEELIFCLLPTCNFECAFIMGMCVSDLHVLVPFNIYTCTHTHTLTEFEIRHWNNTFTPAESGQSLPWAELKIKFRNKKKMGIQQTVSLPNYVYGCKMK